MRELKRGENYVRMRIVREADKKLSKLNRAANKAEGERRRKLRRAYNRQVKAVVDKLDDAGRK